MQILYYYMNKTDLETMNRAKTYEKGCDAKTATFSVRRSRHGGEVIALQ